MQADGTGVPARGEAAGSAPVRALTVGDAVALVVGIVIGAGIFRAPSAVAASVSSPTAMVLVWLAGGVVSLAGAMCYAELAAMHPTPGGDYHYIGRALGRAPAFLFGWARLTVIPTGSLALLGFTFGDYASSALGLGHGASAGFAAALVAGLTALNVAGLHPARGTQNVLTAVLVAALVGITVCGFVVDGAAAAPAQAPSGTGSLGLAMVFVLLTYGGWNDGAYVSAEVRGRRGIVVALVGSIAIVTALYLAVNAAYVRALGLGGVAASSAVAADVLARAIGPLGPPAVAAVVAIAVVTSANATPAHGLADGVRVRPRHAAVRAPRAVVGAPRRRRQRAARGRRHRARPRRVRRPRRGAGSSRWSPTPRPCSGSSSCSPAVSLMVLRRRDPDAPRPFRVPLHPVTPLVFCAACAYLLWSSIRYAGPGAVAGLVVLGTGLVPYWLSTRRAAHRRHAVA